MWPTAQSLAAAIAAATPRTAPAPGAPVWPQGIASNAPAVTPTPWSHASSVSAALARVR